MSFTYATLCPKCRAAAKPIIDRANAAEIMLGEESHVFIWEYMPALERVICHPLSVTVRPENNPAVILEVIPC